MELTMSLIEKPAPDFNMETALGNGRDFGKVALSDYRGRWLVFFFYPLDFTFVCPTEITALNDAHEQFAALDTQVLGASIDSKYSHAAWINTPREHGGLGPLHFPLASDITKQVSRNYGVLIEEEGVALRGLFIIDPEGIVKYQVVHHNNVGRSVEETLRVLQALQSGGLCAANWNPGDPLL
ncbi:biofilm-specific peroxidase; 2-cys peroxiredoxin [Kyrpidia spormannii]|uniref:Biofilm-specific peroxidase 2-cys peroxiredoxin n=2 Tax=Kyrpidia spormannii TaxID=2055160 RepID=A0A6F9E218_9BACL|nr:biofilm-specific peroxidase; 2-cys peroxiredoxin [Kyrpidia spormannii]